MNVRELCRQFPDSYWRALDRDQSYPEEFVQAMTRAGFLGALIPQEYGGLGLSLRETSIILEEVNRSGGNAGPSHAQIYTMGTLLRHGSEEQKRHYLPRIARSDLRLQAFGVTAPAAAKAERRASFELYDERHQAREAARLAMASEFREALRTGDLALYYQPGR